MPMLSRVRGRAGLLVAPACSLPHAPDNIGTLSYMLPQTSDAPVVKGFVQGHRGLVEHKSGVP